MKKLERIEVVEITTAGGDTNYVAKYNTGKELMAYDRNQLAAMMHEYHKFYEYFVHFYDFLNDTKEAPVDAGLSAVRLVDSKGFHKDIESELLSVITIGDSDRGDGYDDSMHFYKTEEIVDGRVIYRNTLID